MLTRLVLFFFLFGCGGGDVATQNVSDQISEEGVVDIIEVGTEHWKIDYTEDEPFPEEKDVCVSGCAFSECKDNADCLSGLCIETPDGKRCTKACSDNSSCPEGFECTQIGTRDIMFACIHPSPRVCRVCVKDDDCKALFSTKKMVCGNGSEYSFCYMKCDVDGGCPKGFKCKDNDICIPESGKCECSKMDIEEKAKGGCKKQNDFGVCLGFFECTEAGIGECSADDPKIEKCNNKDDDCDGETDEDVKEEACELTNQYGTCKGKATCIDGKMICEGTYASQETCNNFDDDCDGETDEGDGLVGCKYTKDDDGDGICEILEKCICVKDVVCTGKDNCPDVSNPGQEDLDNDGKGDDCDPDDDNDGILDQVDNCPYYGNNDQNDKDGDGIGDACDKDKDGDGIENEQDNCPMIYNPEQKDTNNNEIGDDCEDDWDGDGIMNLLDNCPWTVNPTQMDMDNDGKGDECDCDKDGDGVENEADLCEVTGSKDNCPDKSNPLQEDLDNDGVGDLCDKDRDGDSDPNDTDCEPDNPYVSNNALEICNDKDDNCDGFIDEENAIGCKVYYYDIDQDGFGSGKGRCLCNGDGLWSADKAGDCNDTNPSISPEMKEICNANDDDCDGFVDEEGAEGCEKYYKDIDGDGVGNPLKPARCLCGPDESTDYTSKLGDDCNDADPEVNPYKKEICDGKDNDCDGKVDEEGAEGCLVFYKDMDGDGWGGEESKCICSPAYPFTQNKSGDCDDGNKNIYPGGVELCNGKDDDCDNKVDEVFQDLGQSCSVGVGECKAIGKKVCNFDGSGTLCDAKPLEPTEEICDGLDNDCDEKIDEDLGNISCGVGECKVTIAKCVNGVIQECKPLPPKQEICNGKDDDCDGLTDEELPDITCGVGECKVVVPSCKDGIPQTCVPKEPSPEVCNGKDDDCDFLIDEDLGTTTCGIGECKVTVENCKNGMPQTCIPNPPKLEICDNKDNDCDGEIDEDLGTTTCGIGECQRTVDNCVGGQPKICIPGDPIPEICDEKDNDCDGLVDEGSPLGCNYYYKDSDKDGFGAGNPACLCKPTTEYSTPNSGDCNDNDANINPNATEKCDGVDQNCDGKLDAGCIYTNSFDTQNDISNTSYYETCEQCTYEIKSGALEMYCPDNCDAFVVFSIPITGETPLHVEVDCYSWEWYDGAPRNGISFVAPNASFGPWGPNPGYDFLFSDPYDATQGSCCPSDKCPSITKNNSQILACSSVVTSATTTYNLVVDIEPTKMTFSVLSSGANVVTLSSTDTSFRTGKVALHCSESRCRFDNLVIKQ